MFLFLDIKKTKMNKKKLAKFITSEKFYRETESVYKTLERDELFNDGLNFNDYASMSIDEAREYSIQRLKRLYEYGFTNLPYFPLHFALTAVEVDNDTRRGIQFGVCVLCPYLKIKNQLFKRGFIGGKEINGGG